MDQAARELVGSTVRAATSSAYSQARYLSHLVPLAEWSWERGWRPDAGPLLDMDRIERYVAVGMLDAAERTRSTRRSVLRRMALKLQPDLRDLPGREPIAYSPVPVPYSPSEARRFVAAIETQPTPGRRRSLSAVLLLGLGCGLDTRDHRWVSGADVKRDELGVHVTVSGGQRQRIVTCLAEYEDQLHALADGDSSKRLVGGGLTNRKNVTAQPLSRVLLDATLPKLVVGRLRSTWLVTHLDNGTPVPLLMEQAGLKTARPFGDLLDFVRPYDDIERSRWMRAADREPE